MAANQQTRRSEEDPGLSAWLTLLQAHSLLTDAVEADLQSSVGLPLAWFEVLAQLSGAPEGRLTMQELANTVLLSKSGITRLVDRMEGAGLLERQACPTDRRSTYAAVTTAGRDALRDALEPTSRSVAARFTDHVTAAELSMLRTILKKVLDANGFTAQTCPTTVAALDSANQTREAPVG